MSVSSVRHSSLPPPRPRPPELTRQDLEGELEKLYKSKRERHLFAFYGRGVEEEITVPGAGRVRIVPVRSELELRGRMPDLEEREEKIAYLVPFSTELPLDIAGRFALEGRVLRIGPEARLRRLFGACEVDEAAFGSPLATLILSGGAQALGPGQAGGGRLTLQALWEAWLGRAWGVPVQGGLALDALLAWAAADAKGPAFAEAMGVKEAKGVREALFAHLEGLLGPAGPAVWKAWERGEGAVPLELGLLFEVLTPREAIADPGVSMWVRLQARGALGLSDDALALAVATALGQASPSALRALEHRSGEARARALVEAADRRADLPDVRRALAGSARLPAAWKARQDALGAALEAGAQKPGPEAFEKALAAYREIERHAFFQRPDETALAGRAEMALRLLGWLVARPDRALEGPPSLHGDAELLGDYYVREGGYLDRARRAARGSAEGLLGRGIQAVVEAVDSARRELDRRFARAFIAWTEARPGGSRLVPIDEALRKFAEPFLAENEERRLLVLLMDGMAWAQAVELLESLGSRAVPWGPLAWHKSIPLVAARLPTVTEVSRAAFFAGKPISAGMSLDTSKDPQRFQDCPAVARFFSGGAAPRLLLRAEGHTADGAASAEALALVRDPGRRVVGLVINAIDASLSGDAQTAHRWTVESIRSLSDLLEACREAGRTVLFASDHGHVPSDLLRAVPRPADASARYRPLFDPDEVVAENEVKLVLADKSDRAYKPRGSAGLVLLADDTARYGGSAHAGEHGGASLAEVLAPCLLIGFDRSGDALADPALRLEPHRPPAWWHHELALPAAAPIPAPAPSPKAKKAAPENQLAFPQVEPPPSPKPAPPSSKPAPSPLAVALSKSPVFVAYARDAALRETVVLAVDVLLARGGKLSASAFATALGEFPRRAEGFVRGLQEALNLDGYPVLRFDPASREVSLDQELLMQQFEVRP